MPWSPYLRAFVYGVMGHWAECPPSDTGIKASRQVLSMCKNMPPKEIVRAQRLVRRARRIVALTGAGISAESGVPTFRGEHGLWRQHRPEDLATPEAFARDPKTAWEWYHWRRGLLSSCEPNPGHQALARFFLRRGMAGLITQNVDGLHTRAAIEEARHETHGDTPPDPALPLELHGTLLRDRCSRCHQRFDPRPPSPDLPRCDSCDALCRPDVVLFGEPLDGTILTRARRWARRADLCLVVGTSAIVYPAAALPLNTLEAGGSIVEVNVEDTELSSSSAMTLRGTAAEVLPVLLA